MRFFTFCVKQVALDLKQQTPRKRHYPNTQGLLLRKKKEFVDPIDQRLQEIRDELKAIDSYTNTLFNSTNNSGSKVPFLAQENFTYNGTEKPGVYQHLQKVKFNDDNTYQISYCDDEHQVEPEQELESA